MKPELFWIWIYEWMNIQMLDEMLDERVQTRKFVIWNTQFFIQHFVKHAEKMLDEMLDWFAPSITGKICGIDLTEQNNHLNNFRNSSFHDIIKSSIDPAIVSF